MYARTMRVGRRRIQVSCPMGRQFGHLAIEMQLAFARARQTGQEVFLVRSRELVNPALFQLTTDEVAIVGGPAWLCAWLTLRWRVWDATARARMRLSRDIALELDGWMRDKRLPLHLRRR